ncbi:unnamed protein product [Malus baccata var. baccata]
MSLLVPISRTPSRNASPNSLASSPARDPVFRVSDVSLQPAKASVYKGRNFKPTKAWFSGNRQSCRNFGFPAFSPEISTITATPNSPMASHSLKPGTTSFTFFFFRENLGLKSV